MPKAAVRVLRGVVAVLLVGACADALLRTDDRHGAPPAVGAAKGSSDDRRSRVEEPPADVAGATDGAGAPQAAPPASPPPTGATVAGAPSGMDPTPQRSSPATSPAHAGQAAAEAAATGPGLKRPMSGLLDRKGLPPASHQQVVDGFVVTVRWADLQPEASSVLDTSAIDDAIRAARSRAEATQSPVAVKLRVLAGIHAPEWTKRLGGEPVPVAGAHTADSGTVGRFWEPSFGAAYDALQRELAARFDAVEELREVVVSRCTTIFAEPFLRQRENPDVAHALVAAGYTAAADETCQREQILSHEAWARTRSGVAFNVYQRIAPDGSVTMDGSFTEAMMVFCRARLGARCVLENNSVRSPAPKGDEAAMYDRMNVLGGPISFQTESPERIGDAESAIEWAVSKGAVAIELNREYGSYSTAWLESVDARLESRAT